MDADEYWLDQRLDEDEPYCERCGDTGEVDSDFLKASTDAPCGMCGGGNYRDGMPLCMGCAMELNAMLSEPCPDCGCG